MGKPTGFLEYNREVSTAQQPEERIKHFNEFHEHLPIEKQQLQGARCMDCGVPFCQSGMTLCGMTSGCPLHNLVPEWNELVYTGNWTQAYKRLLKTNNFPEFTSRVCPALCEAACTCGLNGDPVATKENEYAIIENAYETSLAKARPPKTRTGKKIAVIGSGPSGLAAADQLNKRGHSVTVFERSDRIGGLLMYGIPNMKLEKNIIERKVNIMKDEGITFITGIDVGKDKKAAELLKEYDRILLACGSSNPRDIKAEGRDAKGIYFAVDFLKANTQSLLDSGFKDKKYIETKDKDGNLKEVIIVKLSWEKDKATGRMSPVQVKGSEKVIPAQIVLIAAGFLGSQKYITDAFGVEVDERTNVKTLQGHFATNVINVFVTGDMKKGQSLVVWAIREGREAAREIDESLMGYTNLSVQ